MRFSERLKKEVVPEWEDCYINYRSLKALLKLVKTSTADRQSIQITSNLPLPQQNPNPNSLPPTNRTSTTLHLPPTVSQSHKLLKSLNEKALLIFTSTLSQQQQLFLQFSTYKINQIQLKLGKAVCYADVGLGGGDGDGGKRSYLLRYLEVLFVEASDLSNMYETNLEIQRRIIDKFQLESCGYYQLPKAQLASRLDIKRLNRLLRQIQQFYIKSRQKKILQSRQKIHRLASQRIHSFKQSLIIGIMIGIFITACIFLAGILIYFQNQVQRDPIFNQDFPTWRGIALFVIYVWILGVNLHHYEKFNISYRNILENNYEHYATSRNMFQLAGFFSTLIIVLFVLYALDVADLTKLTGLNPQLLPIFAWLPLIAYLLNPISLFYRKSRTYMLKYLLKSFISFAIPITYPIVYTTDQLLSLLTPIKDTFQTICYYAHFSSTPDKEESQQLYNCGQPASIAIFVFGIVVFCYRIMQCVKCGLQVQPYNKLDFLNALKYTIAMISSILSYILTINRNKVLPAWITFGILTSIYTFIWDVKFDWLLFEKGSYRLLLRDKLIYSKKIYYILMVMNLFLRFSWVLTISNNIVGEIFGSPEVFLLLFSFLELVRRGIWNMLSVQAEHYKNIMQMSSVPKSFYLLDKTLQKTLTESKQTLNTNSLQRLSQYTIRQTSWNSAQNKKNEQNFQKIKQKVQRKIQNMKQVKLYAHDHVLNDLQMIQYLYGRMEEVQVELEEEGEGEGEGEGHGKQGGNGKEGNGMVENQGRNSRLSE